jgi:acyl-CoA thioesterase-2
MTDTRVHTARPPGRPDLASILELREVSADVYRTVTASKLASADARGDAPRREGDCRRVYGGQLLGQALRAAVLTVEPGRTVHSLHAYFVSGADAASPLDYHVERVRDGGSVSNRRVVARQGSSEVLSLQASFQIAAPGVEHQDRPTEGLSHRDLALADGEAAHRWSGIDLKFAEAATTASAHAVHRRVWFRAAEVVGDDPSLHACVLAYASDLTLVRTALVPHERLGGETFRLASLDHAMWFHRTVRADEWLLLESVSPAAVDSRALTLGYVYDASGLLVATVAQEGVVRVLPT